MPGRTDGDGVNRSPLLSASASETARWPKPGSWARGARLVRTAPLTRRRSERPCAIAVYAVDHEPFVAGQEKCAGGAGGACRGASDRRSQQRIVHRRPGERLLESGLGQPPFRHRAAELVIFDDDQILEPDADRLNPLFERLERSYDLRPDYRQQLRARSSGASSKSSGASSNTARQQNSTL